MAQSNGGRGAAAKKPGARANSKKAAEQARLEAQERYHKQLCALGMFAAGAFLFAVLLVKGQKFWTGMHNALFGLFGWCAWLIPITLVYIAVLATMDKCTIRHKLWQTGVLIVLLCAVTHAFAMGDWEAEGLAGAVQSLYENGVALKGGGVVAGLIGVPFVALFGATGAKVTILILVFVFLMIITGTTLHQFMQSAAKPVRRMEEAYIERAEERRAMREAMPPGGSPRFNIDVPVDEAPLPQHPVQAPKAALEYTDSMQMPRERFSGVKLDVEGPAEPAAPAYPPKQPQPPERVERMNIDEIISKAMGLEANAFKPAFISAEEEQGEIFTPEPPAEEPEESGKFRLSEDALEQINREYVYSEPEEEPIRGGRTLMPVDVYSPDPAPGEAADRALRQALEETAPLPGLAPLVESVEREEPFYPPWEDQAEEPPAEPLVDSKFQVRFTGEEELVSAYLFPPVELLKESKSDPGEAVPEELKANAQLLVDTLNSFGVQTRIIDISRGPAVTRYELQPSAGVKISKITGLADDIALNLAAAGVRIEAPIPNKAAVGIEVPNKTVSTVGIREIIDSEVFAEAASRLTVALGKDISGNITTADIGKMPHLLIAGATGSGKSVCINSLIVSLLYKSTPDEVRLLMIDPKVVELGIYNGIPHLLVPVVTDPRKAAGALNWAVTEMLGRYKLFADNSVRDLKGYNRLAREEGNPLQPMPEIVVIIDELADLMMAAPNEVEDAICRLAQMARAAGMHLVIATQRPSVDVITGVIKANIPSRIAFAVSSQVDSRTILDSGGAEKLLGRGDMLFMPVGASKPTRVQGCFVSDKEVENVVDFIKKSQNSEYDQDIMNEIERQAVAEKGKGSGNDGGGFDENDEMLEKAIEVVVDAGQASTSMLQRRLKLGYARAARLVDEMEQRGIVGPFEGSKPRPVLMTRQQLMEMKLGAGAAAGVPDEL